jgi:hypothetical protein
LKIRKAAAAILLIAALVFASGCSPVAIDELYSLPQPPEKYVQLQTLIDEEIASGSEYSAPTSGNYRQSVQLHDLDGDGREEALAFFRNSQKNLKICIFNSEGNTYSLAAVIDGEGTAIGKIEYADLDGDSSVELIVAWQVSAGLRMLKVCSVREFQSSVLLTADCSEFLVSDLNGDGRNELVILHFDGNGNGSVELVDLSAGGEPQSSVAKMSEGLESIDWARTGVLSDGTPALFIEGLYGEGVSLLTDVFVYAEGKIANISMDKDTGVSGTVRDYKVYSTDIDSDRAMEIPSAIPLYSQPDSTSPYWLFDWYSYDSRGNKTLDLSTYHCYSDGWYLVLPEKWRENFTVRREAGVAGERIVVLSTVDPLTEKVEDFLMIYTLTGENRWEKAKIGNRFVLLEESSIIYAARILDETINKEDIISSFRLIYTEWITGAI